MQIEIAEYGRMAQSGSSLLRLIQNNSTPILDLLVRESIQNSLDARIIDREFVNVDFLTGKFISSNLTKELDGITESLDNIYHDNKYDYIAIKDYNTSGLTGKLHYDELIDNKYGNLLKLIYEISKPQENEGSGGSWGLGKTVYFRVGIGLVIYYSRIKDESGKYCSRLAATFVEDEKKENTILPKLNSNTNLSRGIAWWGEKIGSNKTQPIVDEEYIKKILAIFDIEEYKDLETGTTIIIPYIDLFKLLNDNQVEYPEHLDNHYWKNDLNLYLKTAIQRWYSPRIDNRDFKDGYLKVKINNDEIVYDKMDSIFQLIQSLYNRANSICNDNDIITKNSIDVKVEDIHLKKVLKYSSAGKIAFTKVSSKILKIDPPNNKPIPYIYCNLDINSVDNKNKPIICFTRKPGMIVSYEDVGSWVDKIGETDEYEFLIGIFVLNSENIINDVNLSLEEYIRKSEMADHKSWSDFAIDSKNYDIVKKIQRNINSKICNAYLEETGDSFVKLNSSLGKKFGELLLPPRDFGKKPISKTTKNKTQKISKGKGYSLELNNDRTVFKGNKMEITLGLIATEKINDLCVALYINSEGGSISLREWHEKYGLKLPIYIEKCKVQLKTADGYTSQIDVNIDNNCEMSPSNKEMLELKLLDNKGISFSLSSDNRCNTAFVVILTLHIDRRDVSPLFKVEKVGEINE